MKRLLLTLTILSGTAGLMAQSNEPVRLALVSISGDTSTASDVLTAELSRNHGIHLLERNEIEKVYREQGLLAGNKDFLKLGQILGADGLLILSVVQEPTPTAAPVLSRATAAGIHAKALKPSKVMEVRLIAVKPGVVLGALRFAWPGDDLTQWASGMANHFAPDFPKLGVLVKDAIPISVVNLRSAVQSTEAQDTERQLKLLTIERLTQERQFFVLERQRMQWLSEEKELKSDESAFWNGSYLLEGVVDQNGYSKESITLDAQLIPSKGGAPLRFEVSGNRTNYSELVNQLATRVAELLKIKPSLAEWRAADEAAQYFDEAKWGLRWGMLPEAQAAAESAWALGKRDLACALVRIRAYISEVPKLAAPGTRYYQYGKMDSHYVQLDEPSDPKYCDVALYALRCYYEFCRTSPDGEPKVLTRGKGWNDWHASDWYQLGIDDLVAASRVLQHFNMVPQSQKPMVDKLGALRALARSVADLISRSPSVHDTYYVGDRIAVYDELAYTIGEENQNPNIFSCKLGWGFLWQESPEDCVAVYRELMNSPAFCYIHRKFWFPDRYELPISRLAAWNEEDRKRIPAVWNTFVRELHDSTNVLLQLEAKALRLASAATDRELAVSFTNFFDAIFENREALITNNVDLLYLEWGADNLVEKMGRDAGLDSKAAWQRLYYSQYRPKLEAMHREYRDRTVAARQNLEAFEKQKRYLKDNKPYDFAEFVTLFTFTFSNYSTNQALEIQPLVIAYKSNLVAQSERAPPMKKGEIKGAIAQVGFLERDLDRILNPSAPPATNTKIVQILPASPASVRSTVSGPVEKAVEPSNESSTSILPVNRFLRIPCERIEGDNVSGISCFAQRWSEGKLLADLEYNTQTPEFDERGEWRGTRGAHRAAIAIFDPAGERWRMVNCPDIPEFSASAFGFDNNRNRSLLFRGDLYWCENGRISKFDLKSRQWQTLPIPELEADQLFAAEEHLFAVGRNTVFEITHGGKSTRILASTRRRPAVNALDLLNNLDSLQLFSRPGHPICASVGTNIFSWDESDWHEVLTLNISQPPEIFEDVVILRAIPAYGSDDPGSLWIWKNGQLAPELCVLDKPRPHPGIINSWSRIPKKPASNPYWHPLEREYLTSATVTPFKSNLYFLVDHAEVTNVRGHWTSVEKNGYQAKLVCLSRDCTEPVVVPLKFDTERGQLPLQSLLAKAQPWLVMRPAVPAATMHFAEDRLFLGQWDTLGIWTIPVSEIDSAVTSQKQLLLAQASRDKALAVGKKERLMSIYDKNQNGLIDPEEKESAINNPVFLKFELTQIDTNANGWLDAEELAYFDANRNRILETREEEGIKTSQGLLAAKLIDDFDQNGDGQLDQNEFAASIANASTMGGRGGPRTMQEFLRFDQNHDQKLNGKELKSCLEQFTDRSLREKLRPIYRASPTPGTMLQLPFKEAVELYWKNGDQRANRSLPADRRPPPLPNPARTQP